MTTPIPTFDPRVKEPPGAQTTCSTPAVTCMQDAVLVTPAAVLQWWCHLPGPDASVPGEAQLLVCAGQGAAAALWCTLDTM